MPLSRVGTIRLAQGLTQEALAHEAKVALRLLGGIERGQRNPTVEMVGKITEALGVHPPESLRDRAMKATSVPPSAGNIK